MWLVVVEKAKEFEELSSKFLKEDRKAYVQGDTPFGAPLLIANPDTEKPYPSFLLLSQGWPTNRDALIWCYKNMKVDSFVSSGIVDTLTLKETQTSQVFLPSECVRSEGNLDLLSGPLLYEEFPFDLKIQEKLRRLLVERIGRGVENTSRIFSTTKEFHGKRLRKVLRDELNCMGFDDFTGELSLFCRSLNVPVGCLKICARGSTDPLRDLSTIWLGLFELVAQEAAQK